MTPVSPAALQPALHHTPLTGVPLTASPVPNSPAPASASSPFATNAAQQSRAVHQTDRTAQAGMTQQPGMTAQPSTTQQLGVSHQPGATQQPGMSHHMSQQPVMTHQAGFSQQSGSMSPVSSAQHGQSPNSVWLNGSNTMGSTHTHAPANPSLGYGHHQDPRVIASGPVNAAVYRQQSASLSSPTRARDNTAQGRKLDMGRASSVLHHSAKASTASTAIAAAARANAAAANAIAESGALTQLSPGLSHQDTADKGSTGQFGPASAAAGAISPRGFAVGSAAMAGPVLVGRAGPHQTGQPNALPASQAGAVPAQMTHHPANQQQHLTGAAMMTAMQLPNSGQSGQQAVRPMPTMSPAGVNTGANPSLSPGYGSAAPLQPYYNPSFNMSSGPAPFKASAAYPNPGLRTAPYMSSSNPPGSTGTAGSSVGLQTGINPGQQPGSNIPYSGPAFQPTASGLPNPGMAASSQALTSQVKTVVVGV